MVEQIVIRNQFEADFIVVVVKPDRAMNMDYGTSVFGGHERVWEDRLSGPLKFGGKIDIPIDKEVAIRSS